MKIIIVLLLQDGGVLMFIRGAVVSSVFIIRLRYSATVS